MHCTNCHISVPEGSIKCPSCRSRIKFSLPTYQLPNADMYGNEIFVFYPDEHKKSLRNNYVWKLPEQNSARNTYKNAKDYNTLTIFICFLIIILPFLVSITFGLNLEPSVLKFIEVVAIVLSIGFFIYRRLTGNWNSSKSQYKFSQLHSSKLHYYASEAVIGYSVLDHVIRNKKGPDTYYYAFYEVPRESIKEIKYDSYYAEYVLVLKSPVFMDFGIDPVYEFKIADIFDDAVLSQALCCDLPAKTMNF